ncbi:MAG: hypothetical protein JWM85_2505 [Acidimicrobiaceae bacterium]|nr:hypothetical protein [Acidimicrobiaceae bacterium]
MSKDKGGAQPSERLTGRFAGLPYDLRRPSLERLRAEVWNPDSPRLLTPKAFGWGYGLNLYWVSHPLGYLRRRTDR